MSDYPVPNTPPKFKVGDPVLKSWYGDTDAPGTILLVGTDKTKTVYVYQAKFPNCEGFFLEGDLKPVPQTP